MRARDFKQRTKPAFPAEADVDARSGIQSVDVALRVLDALIALGGPAALGAIATEAEITPSQLHRYLVTFVRRGIAVQCTTGEYDLGPTLRRYGIAAIKRSDPNNLVSERVIALRDATDMTVFLTVWAESGPTIVRWEGGGQHVPIMFRLGSTLPLTQSATGRLFLALLPERITAEAYRADTAPHDGTLRSKLRAIRDAQMSSSSNEMLPGLSVYAAPVLDHQGDLYGAMSLLVPHSHVERADGVVHALREAVADASRALGYEV